jgi:SsrA-binding protein
VSFEKDLARNRAAFHNYAIEERYEAGIVLQGTEVKALREGAANLKDSYARVKEGEVWLLNCHISPYTHGTAFNHDPLRPRKLLLHKREIQRLHQRVKEKGLTLVPVRLYFRKGRVKVEIALAKGKTLYDKRETIKKRDTQREARLGRRV